MCLSVRVSVCPSVGLPVCPCVSPSLRLSCSCHCYCHRYCCPSAGVPVCPFSDFGLDLDISIYIYIYMYQYNIVPCLCTPVGTGRRHGQLPEICLHRASPLTLPRQAFTCIPVPIPLARQASTWIEFSKSKYKLQVMILYSSYKL